MSPVGFTGRELVELGFSTLPYDGGPILSVFLLNQNREF